MNNTKPEQKIYKVDNGGTGIWALCILGVTAIIGGAFGKDGFIWLGIGLAVVFAAFIWHITESVTRYD